MKRIGILTYHRSLNYGAVMQSVAPINYFRRDMSEDEFERIIESAKTTTFETLDNNESSTQE